MKKKDFQKVLVRNNLKVKKLLQNHYSNTKQIKSNSIIC